MRTATERRIELDFPMQNSKLGSLVQGYEAVTSACVVCCYSKNERNKP